MQVLMADQYKSLRTLKLRTCVKQTEIFRKDVGRLSLETLEVASWCRYQKVAGLTSAEMLLQSLQTLKSLRLGFENALAKSYARWDSMAPLQPNLGQITADFVSVLRDRTGERHTAVRLKELSLCGMDLTLLAPEISPIDFNFGGLTSLRLESCSNLPQALPKLRPQRQRPNANVGGLSNLCTFSVRIENGDDNTMRAIKAFLMITKPLKTLHFLFEGRTVESITPDVLERHGTSLDSLVWDTRLGPRCDIQSYEEPEQWSIDCFAIKRYCVNLKALGVSFPWEDADLDRGRPIISRVCSLLIAMVTRLIVTVDAAAISPERSRDLEYKKHAKFR